MADQETLALLKRFSRNPEIEKASVEFERTQKVEERFHRDFDGLDLPIDSRPCGTCIAREPGRSVCAHQNPEDHERDKNQVYDVSDGKRLVSQNFFHMPPLFSD